MLAGPTEEEIPIAESPLSLPPLGALLDLAEGYLEAGQLDDAEQLADEAIEICEEAIARLI